MIRLAFIFSSLFVLSGCSVIGGHSFTNIFMGILATFFFIGCNNEFYKVKPVNVVNPEPEPQPGSCVAGTALELGVSDYLQAGDVYIPNSELQEVDATSTNLKEHATSYNNCGGVNYFKLDRAATSTLIAAPAGEVSKDFVVVTTDYLNVAQPTIELGDGDDTIVFEGYQNFVNTVGSVDMGAGDDKVILGGADFNDYLNPGSLTLGAGADRVYVGPIENYSMLNMDFSEDKIVLTGGLVYSDLIFLDSYGDHFLIQTKELNSVSSEWINVTLLRLMKRPGLTTLSQLQDPSNFEVGGVVNAKKGLYKSVGSKFPVSEYPTYQPSYYIDMNESGSINLDYTSVQSYYNPGTPFEYVSDPYVYITSTPFEYIAGAAIPYEYVTGYAGSGFANFDSDVRSAYFTAPPYFGGDLSSSSSVYFSTNNSGRIFFKLSPNMPQYKRTFNIVSTSSDSTFVSHAFDVSSVVANGFTLDLVLNGKLSGSVDHSSGQHTNIVLSRVSSGASVSPGADYYFHLGDYIEYSDLSFFEDTSTGLVHIQVTDDSGKVITIVRIKDKTLADVRISSRFQVLP